MPQTKLRLPLLIGAALLAVTGACAGSIFGRNVPIDRNDTTPPTVRIELRDADIDEPDGPLVVRSEDATATVVRGRRAFQAVAYAEDPEGLRFVELGGRFAARCSDGLDTRFEPEASLEPARFPEAPAAGEPAPTTAPTRLAVPRQLRFPKTDSPLCPPERKNLVGVKLRLRAVAANYGPSGPAHSGEVTLIIDDAGRAQTGVGATRAGPPVSPPSCPMEGETCEAAVDACRLRGDDFKVPSRYVCDDGRPVCKPQGGVDYCTNCGGPCGSCGRCAAETDCAPGDTCTEGANRRCNRICTVLGGMCWLPDEKDDFAVRALVCGR